MQDYTFWLRQTLVPGSARGNNQKNKKGTWWDIMHEPSLNILKNSFKRHYWDKKQFEYGLIIKHYYFRLNLFLVKIALWSCRNMSLCALLGSTCTKIRKVPFSWEIYAEVFRNKSPQDLWLTWSAMNATYLKYIYSRYIVWERKHVYQSLNNWYI